jgi:hypothetical protein
MVDTHLNCSCKLNAYADPDILSMFLIREL